MLRDKAYRVLSDLVNKGFLTVGMDLIGVSFVFKTVNESEFELIKLYSGLQSGSGYNLKFNTYFLAFSVFLVEGENVLSNRSKNIRLLYDFFSRIPISLHTRMIAELEALKQDTFEASKYLEGFCYTEHSRILWKTKKGLPNQEELTGIEGTHAIGLNFCQNSWMLINRSLDDEEEYNKEFSFAVLIASASNPKGSKNIRAKHDAALQAMEGKRKKLAREGSSPDKTKWNPEGWAAPVDTAEELVAELERQMQGKKDKHDLFIEEYIRKLEEAEEKAKQEEEKRLAVYRQKIKDEGFPVTGTHRALTPGEAEKLMARSKDKSNNLVILPSDEIAGPEERDRYFKKIGSKVLTARK
jgi:hypothetical protein